MKAKKSPAEKKTVGERIKERNRPRKSAEVKHRDVPAGKAAAWVEGDQIYLIPLDQVRPAPWNPPARMNPEKVAELAESILLRGQEIPALIRPVEDDPRVPYEIVFGHRRYAARALIAGKPGGAVWGDLPVPAGIKTFIRFMSEEEAMILSGIENLQRLGFNDIEEAEFFRAAGERYGESAVRVLAEKLSVSERYIRKRVEILKLPEAALELWRAGTWHVGHMEQLLRIGEDKVESFLVDLEKRNQLRPELAVWQLKGQVDRLAIPLSHARFEKSDCKVCRKNTAVQLTLFGGEKDKTSCLDQECFLGKQQAWLDVNWVGCKANREGTRAAVIGDFNTSKTGEFSSGNYVNGHHVAQKCESCQNYMSIVNIKGEIIYSGRVCMGDKACFAGTRGGKNGKGAEQKGAGNGSTPDEPRCGWHGEYFRQEFYKEEVPQLLEGLLTEDPRRLQLALATIIHGVPRLHEWLCSYLSVRPKKRDSYRSGFFLYFDQILEVVSNLKPLQAEYLIAEASVKAAFDGGGRNYEIQFNDDARAAIAEFLSIDWNKFQVSDEWMEKKTKGELVRFIAHESGLRGEVRFEAYCKAHGIGNADVRKIPEQIANLKKGAIVDLIKNCGVDLHGRLPAEIEKKPKRTGRLKHSRTLKILAGP